MGSKITIIGAGSVGSTIAHILSLKPYVSELVMIDILKDKADGEIMDMAQGTGFRDPISMISGDYEDAAGSDIVIVTSGVARKPGQTRIELAKTNVAIMKSIAPQVAKHAPNALCIIVANPVDVLTYAFLKYSGMKENQVIGSGTMLDSARLRSIIAENVNINPKNVHGYVLGEHGDSSVVPWSLITVSGMELDTYCNTLGIKMEMDLDKIAEEMRTSGAKVIGLKGATYYAIALSVTRICDCIMRDTNSVLAISTMINNRYGINDVCLSLPAIIGKTGIIEVINPPLLPAEEERLQNSANTLRALITDLAI